MRHFTIAILALTLYAAYASLDHVSIKVDDKDSTGLFDTHFPPQFSFNATERVPSGVVGDVMHAVDGPNDIYRMTQSYYSSAFGKNVTDTYIKDFRRGRAYVHTTGNPTVCMDQGPIDRFDLDVSKMVDYVWDTYAKLIADKWEGGHHYQWVNIPYNQQWNETIVFVDDIISQMYGYEAGSYNVHNLTVRVHQDEFRNETHFPAACR